MHLTKLNEELLQNLKNMQMKITYLNGQNNNNNNDNNNNLHNFYSNFTRENIEEKGFYASNNKNANGNNLNYSNNKANLRNGNDFADADSYNGKVNDRNNYEYNDFNANGLRNKNYNENNNGIRSNNNVNKHRDSYVDAAAYNFDNQVDVRFRNNGDYRVYSEKTNKYRMGNNDPTFENNNYSDSRHEMVIYSNHNKYADNFLIIK